MSKSGERGGVGEEIEKEAMGKWREWGWGELRVREGGGM
jgi:hypothetical protein